MLLKTRRSKDVNICDTRVCDTRVVRGELFRQPILTNHVAGFLFSLRVARTNLPSGKRALHRF